MLAISSSQPGAPMTPQRMKVVAEPTMAMRLRAMTMELTEGPMAATAPVLTASLTSSSLTSLCFLLNRMARRRKRNDCARTRQIRMMAKIHRVPFMFLIASM